ncbi:MAG: hypothetical protein LBU32_11950 [Clostridiales bacterium]|jgi:hypothetical protein|nr:hypothetical protein [Clostridiales bacterium]
MKTLIWMKSRIHLQSDESTEARALLQLADDESYTDLHMRVPILEPDYSRAKTGALGANRHISSPHENEFSGAPGGGWLFNNLRRDDIERRAKI